MCGLIGLMGLLAVGLVAGKDAWRPAGRDGWSKILDEGREIRRRWMRDTVRWLALSGAVR